MAGKPKKHTSSFKAKVALEAIEGRHTVREIAAGYEIHPTRIGNWKRQLLQRAEKVFDRGGSSREPGSSVREAQLYEEIGRLKVQLDWLKKKAAMFAE